MRYTLSERDENRLDYMRKLFLLVSQKVEILMTMGMMGMMVMVIMMIMMIMMIIQMMMMIMMMLMIMVIKDHLHTSVSQEVFESIWFVVEIILFASFRIFLEVRREMYSILRPTHSEEINDRM